MSAVPALLLVLTLTSAGPTPDPPPHVPGPRPSPLLAARQAGPLQQGFTLDTVPRRIPPTQWKKGALIGGLTVGLGFALFFEAWCRQTSDSCFGPATGGFLVGGTIGGVLGALIGGQFPKDDG